MTIGNRIKARRQSLGYSVDQLADLIGKNRATVYRYENNDIESFPSSLITLLAKALKTTPSALLGWEDQSINSEVDLNIESSLNHIRQAERIKQGARIPVLGKVAAGIPIEAIEDYNTEEWEEIGEEMASYADYFALKIKGLSMEPKFSEGDIVIVRKQDDIESGDIGVVMVENSEATVKRIIKQDNGILLVASNQAVYPPKFYDLKAIQNLPVKILGKVVELRAKF